MGAMEKGDAAMDSGDEKKKAGNPCTRCQRAFVGGMENIFRKYGELAAKWWYIFIVASFLLCMLLAAGNQLRKTEEDQLKMWVSADHPYRKNTEWLNENKPASDIKANSVLIKTDLNGDKNLLSAAVIKKLYQLRKKIANINANVADSKVTWEYTCYRQRVNKAPTAPAGGGGGGGTPPAFPDDICPLMNEALKKADGPGTICSESHVLELWADAANNSFTDATETAVDALTDADIITAVNDPAAKSKLTGKSFQLSQYVGASTNESGKVTSTKAMTMLFLNMGGSKFNETNLWEKEFIETVQNFSKSDLEPLKIKAVPFASRSFGDVYGNDIQNDLGLFIFGYIIVFCFVMLMIGKFNLVESRCFLAIAGIMCVGMGIMSSYGLCGAAGLPFTNMNSIMPFLLLGIGIDDMFVIVQSFDNLKGEELTLPLLKRFGITMKHAGVAITITSVTDLLAFGVGGSTAIPALSSFCVYAAVGIVFVFLYMISFFFGWFYLDQRRMESDRNFFICCYKHKDYTPNACSQKSLQKTIFEKIAGLLTKLPVKIVIIILTCGMLGLTIWGTIQLEPEFKYIWYVREGTYVREFMEARETHFPSASGTVGEVYIGNVDYPANMAAIKDLIQKMKDASGSGGPLLDDGTMDNNFPTAFEKWVVDTYQSSAAEADRYPQKALDSDTFYSYLSRFIFIGGGLSYVADLEFEDPPGLQCADKMTKLKLISIPYVHKYSDKGSEKVTMMNDLSAVLAKSSLPADAKVFGSSQEYVNYVTLETITEELLRNILLALLCVLLATLFLLADVFMSLIVVLNVLITLINVTGFMFIWGISIDTAAAILLTISLGLAVDYSAHIAHAFMATPGDTRNERMKESLVDMGPAVFNGGFSTFLAFALLMTSSSHVFLTFFKIFFLVVLFGLFNGIIFLPVVLSLIGPGATSGDDHGSGATVVPIDQRPTSAWSTSKEAPAT